MKQSVTILFSFLMVFTFLETAKGQTTVYSDDFTGEDNKGQIGTTLDVTGVDWSLDVSNGNFSDNDDFFAVQTGVFAAQDVDGDVIWESESFSLSGFSNLEFSFDAGAEGDFEASGDIFDVEIIIDSGTPETLFSGTVDESVSGDPMFFGSTQLTNSLQTFKKGITGSGTNARIRITVNNNAGSEIYRFDNLEITESNISPEPSNHVTSFSSSSSSISEVDLSWTDATGITPPENYLILLNDSGTFTAPLDGTPQSDDTDLSDGSGVLNVAQGVESAVFSNLQSNTQYFFEIYPYTNLGTNINYKTDGTIPSANVSTLEKPNLVLNEILSDPGEDANGDGIFDTSDDEFLEFVNTGNTDLDISGWIISDETTDRHTFPSNTILRPNQAIVVFDGGTPTGDFGGALTQIAGNLSLNNSGEKITVHDSSGNTLIEENYGGANDQSETRNPDLTGTFENHTTADTNDQSVFSPGTRVDGSTFQPSVTFSGGEGWRMISSPTQGNTYQDLLGDIWTQCSMNADYNGSLCDSDPNTEPNVLIYDGSDFVNAGDLDDSAGNSMIPGQGFIVFVFSDDDFDRSAENTGFPKKIDVFGDLNTGNINAPLNTGNGTFSLVGNPYNKPIDWDELDTSDFSGTVYVYDHTYGSIDGGGDDAAETRNSVGGGYRTWNSSGAGSLTGGVIAPFQGFWVESSTANPNLTFEESAQASGGTFYSKENQDVISIRLRSEMKNMFSEAFLSFTESGDLGEDKNDGLKLSPLDFRNYMSLSTDVDGTQMEINNLPVELFDPVEIPLHAQAFEAVESGWALLGGEIILSWPEMNNIPSDWEITLTDTQLNRTIDLKIAKNYLFEAERSQAKIANKKPFRPFNPKPFQKEKAVIDARFLITINPNNPDGLVDNDIPDQFALEQNYPNPFNPATTIRYEIAETSNVLLSVYNVMGQRIATLVDESKAPGTYQVVWDAREMASGIYYYRLTANGVVFNRQMTLIK